MRLLLWHWGRRGAGPRYTLELARALEGRCEVALSLSRQSELFAETAALGLPGFYVDTYSSLSSAVLSSIGAAALRPRFRAYLAEQRFDAVIATMHHVWCPLFADLVDGLVFVVHDADPHPGDSALAWRVMLDREIEASAALVALSEHVAGRLRRRYAIAPGRLSVIPHPPFGFAGARAAPRQFPGGRPVRLTFFGRIKAYKGIGLLLEAVRLVQEKHAVALLIAGQGSLAPYAAQLESLGQVSLLNRWIAEGEVQPILDDSDIIIAPYIEASQSGVIPSAYGAGIPVIATPVGGLIEQLRDGETGLLARAPTAEALAEAIGRMITDPALYERCSAGALAAARGTLGWEGVASAYLRIAESLKAAGGRRGREDRAIKRQ